MRMNKRISSTIAGLILCICTALACYYFFVMSVANAQDNLAGNSG